jgi:hypothetical protein
MNANKTTMMPEMELRETLRRFGWLVGVLSVIWVLAVAVQEPAARLIERRQESIRPSVAELGLMAVR